MTSAVSPTLSGRMNAAQLATASTAIEAHLLAALQQATARASEDPTEQFQLGGAVTVLLLRHYYQSCADPQGWLEGAIRAVLQP